MDTKFILTRENYYRGQKIEDKQTLEIEIVGNKMYMRTLEHDSVSARVDITQVWNFFKDVQKFVKTKKK